MKKILVILLFVVAGYTESCKRPGSDKRPGEVLLQNISIDSYIDSTGMMINDIPENIALKHNFAPIGLKTKRLGTTAYDRNGNVIKGMKPVYVQDSELKSD